MSVLARVTSKFHHRIELQTDGVCGECLSSLSSVPAKHHRSDHRTQSSATTNTCISCISTSIVQTTMEICTIELGVLYVQGMMVNSLKAWVGALDCVEKRTKGMI
ncbi:uncharacterized protein LOC111342623 isoform X1 [Stylophora pistillata]|uniref:uncharacterized protein LOC111342623 isoform X1 n=1 Tax=Stylophora pistillata TaxID=50429 RepID=UPI000C046650|nr:uncharacterized protein LOC111342623 isoform X1 [Stylophora pistillata]